MKRFFARNWKVFVIWGAIVAAVLVGLRFGLDKKIVAFGIIVFGILTHAFAGLMGIIALVPIVGPLVVKIATLPAIWITNALAYVITFVALRRGAKMDVVKSRVLVTSFIIGVVVGFVIGKLL
jgi:hypothetical protein